MRKLILWLTLTGIALSTATEWRPATFNITYSDLLLIIASLLALFLRWNGTSILGDVRVLAFFGCGVVLFYFGFLISFTQGDPLRFLLVAAQYAFCFFLLPYIFSRSAQCSPTAFERGAMYFLFFLALTSFGGFVGYFLFNDAMRSLELVALNDRYQGLVANPNRFSSLITLSLPLLFGLRSAQCISSPVLLMVLVSFLAGLTVASSIGGFLSAAVTLAVMGAINLRPTFALKGMLVVTLLGIVLVSSFGVPKVFEQRVLSKFDSNQSVDASNLGSFDSRMAIAEEAMRRIVNNPVIGAGLDNYLERSTFGHTVHNTMLLVWAEGGSIALLGLIVIGLTPLMAYMIVSGGKVTRSGLSVAVGFTVALFTTMQVFAHLYSRAWFIPYFLTIWLILRISARTAPRQASGLSKLSTVSPASDRSVTSGLA